MGSGNKYRPESSKALQQISQEQYELIRPTLEESAGQVEEIVRSGGSTAQIPAIQKAIESSIAATSTSKKRTEENLVRSGVTGTDYQTILALLGQQGELTTSQIPFQYSAPIVQQAYATALGIPALTVQGLGEAGRSEAATTGIFDPFLTDVLPSLVEAAGQVTAAYVGGT